MTTKILGISGSLREGSHSRRLLERTLLFVGEFDGETRLVDLREMQLPLLQPGMQSEADFYQPMRKHVLWADALILASPDYHGSMSGTIKNFLDYFWTEFTGRLFGYIVASHEKGLTVQDQMRTAARQPHPAPNSVRVARHI